MGKRMTRVRDLAHVRSGDKGGICDLTVVARDDAAYDRLRIELTAATVRRAFDDLPVTAVDRHELPQLRALKFVLHGALGAGVTGNLTLDAHGKCLSSCLIALDLSGETVGRSGRRRTSSLFASTRGTQ
jgi:hypothetical protein